MSKIYANICFYSIKILDKRSFWTENLLSIMKWKGGQDEGGAGEGEVEESNGGESQFIKKEKIIWEVHKCI